jgi:hypothetical protein
VNQRIVRYHGYTLEITPVAIDVVTPRGYYLVYKVDLRQAMLAIHWHRKVMRQLTSDQR